MVLPGGVLPGGFEIAARKTYGHVSAGMICSARELGLGDDHDGIIVLPRRRRRRPGDDARRAARPRDEVIEFEINPDRAYALSLRGVAREAALGVRRAVPRPGAARRARPPNDDGYPVVRRRRRPAARSSWPARSTGFDPAAPTPRLDGPAARSWPGMRPISLAVDVTNYVMLELGQPIHGYDARQARRARSSCAGRREGERLDHPRRRRPRARRRGPVVTDDSGTDRPRPA